MENARYKKGVQVLNEINANNAERIEGLFKDVAPDMGRFIIEFAYGDIHSRPGLDIKTRELATIASLVTSGHSKGPLKAHIKNALDVGATRAEIIEVIMQMSVYAGFPAALDGLFTAKEIFSD